MKEILNVPLCLRCGKPVTSYTSDQQGWLFCECKCFSLDTPYLIEQKNTFCPVCNSPKLNGHFKKGCCVLGCCSNPKCSSFSRIKSFGKSTNSFDIYSHNVRTFLVNTETKRPKIYLFKGAYTIRYPFLKNHVLSILSYLVH